MKKLIENRLFRTAFLVTGAALLGAWVAPMVRAAPGATLGPHLSFAGSLRQNGAPITTQQTVGFTFKKDGVAACTPADMTVTPDAEGQFTALIPLVSCPAGLFNGKEVHLDIRVAGEVAVADQLITPAPTALYAEHAGYPDCPLGYQRDTAVTAFVLCKQGADEVVRVGTKSTAFWVDRYEASVWEFADGTGAQYGDGLAEYPYPPTGQLGVDNAKGFALSKPNVMPSTKLTWFQADVACHQIGKRLPTSAEWGLAARGTIDPGNSAGEDGKCRNSGGARTTGQGAACVSVWGAQDLVGNVSEFVSDWLAAPPLSTTDPTNGIPGPANWGVGFGNDHTTNLSSVAAGVTTWVAGVPAAIVRGGGNWEGEGAGVFNLNLSMSPSSTFGGVGFRCVIPR
jgi:formylglycine-generating enzyme required for sulfatase activity